jgi:hypothetical protein
MAGTGNAGSEADWLLGFYNGECLREAGRLWHWHQFYKIDNPLNQTMPLERMGCPELD